MRMIEISTLTAYWPTHSRTTTAAWRSEPTSLTKCWRAILRSGKPTWNWRRMVLTVWANSYLVSQPSRRQDSLSFWTQRSSSSFNSLNWSSESWLWWVNQPLIQMWTSSGPQRPISIDLENPSTSIYAPSISCRPPTKTTNHCAALPASLRTAPSLPTSSQLTASPGSKAKSCSTQHIPSAP